MEQNKRSRKEGIEKQLKAYSLAAGTVVAFNGAADADVIYSNANMTLSGAMVMQPLDLDGDLTADFMFSLYNNASGAGQYMIPNPLVDTNLIAGSYVKFGTATTSYTFKIKKMELGATIGPGGLFDVPGYLIAMKSTGGSSSGSFQGSRGYLGFRFESAGETHYGWMDIETSTDLHQLTVHGWAYEDTPNMAIQAGSMVPQPDTLALLATGMAGLLAYRNHRRKSR